MLSPTESDLPKLNLPLSDLPVFDLPEFDLQLARDYLARVVVATAAKSAYNPALTKLRGELTQAIQACEAATQNNVLFEERLSNQSHVLWLCNQCEYYLTVPSAAIALPRKDRALWQIKAVVRAIARFKIIAQLRGLLPGPAPASLSWQDILPGFKL